MAGLPNRCGRYFINATKGDLNCISNSKRGNKDTRVDHYQFVEIHSPEEICRVPAWHVTNSLKCVRMKQPDN